MAKVAQLLAETDELLAENLELRAALQQARDVLQKVRNMIVDDTARPNAVSLKRKDDVLREVRFIVTSKLGGRR
jgi:hypothetical protein